MILVEANGGMYVFMPSDIQVSETRQETYTAYTFISALKKEEARRDKSNFDETEEIYYQIEVQENLARKIENALRLNGAVATNIIKTYIEEESELKRIDEPFKLALFEVLIDHLKTAYVLSDSDKNPIQAELQQLLMIRLATRHCMIEYASFATHKERCDRAVAMVKKHSAIDFKYGEDDEI